mgnify:CR=1 FL=1
MSEELKNKLEEIGAEELQSVEAAGGNKIPINGKQYEIVFYSNKKCAKFVEGNNPYTGKKYADKKHCGGCANLDKYKGFWYCTVSAK